MAQQEKRLQQNTADASTSRDLKNGGRGEEQPGGNKTDTNYGGQDFWIVKLATREAPIGTPVVLVNGLYSPSNSFFIPATNTASVTLTSTFPGGYIYYSLDGVLPVPGEGNTFAYSSPGNPGAPFVVSNSVVVLAVAYSSDETGNVPADADPVAIHIVPLYNLTNTTYLSADYLSYYNRKNTSIDGLSLGVGYRF